MGAGASVVISFLNFGLGVSGTGLGIASLAISGEIEKIIDDMNDEIKKNQKVIDDYNSFEDIIAVTASPVFENELSKIKILLSNNLEDIRLYYNSIKKTMDSDKDIANQFHDIQNNLPGSIPAWQWGLQSGMLTVQLIFSVYALYQSKKLYAKWKSQRGN